MHRERPGDRLTCTKIHLKCSKSQIYTYKGKKDKEKQMNILLRH
jgi:hypothetical protein